MKLQLALCVALGGLSDFAYAAVTPEEAQELGRSLTPFGAIQAGNAEGTIPPYEGGLGTAPADFKPGSFWTNPFRDEKPLYRITADNVQEYADKLSEGQKTLLKQYPDTWYMDVYQATGLRPTPPTCLKPPCATLRTARPITKVCRWKPIAAGACRSPLPKTAMR